jgi:hypothetical protein
VHGAGLIADRRAQGDRVLGINLNELVPRGALDDPLPLSVLMAREIASMRGANGRVSFVCIAHDRRGNCSDQPLHRIAALLAWERDPRLEERCFTVSTARSAREDTVICGELELLVSGRMHRAIASLDMGTPAMWRHFGMPQCALEIAEAFGEHGIAAHSRAILAGEGPGRTAILARLPAVHSLARRNCEPAAVPAQAHSR